MIARAVQGVGGAVVSAVALSLMMMLFTEPAERAKAMGVFGFVASGGGSIGVLLGGILTDVLNWHWIFLVNVPVGFIVLGLTFWLIPAARVPTAAQRLDVAGAVTVTAALMIAVYAIVNGNEVGWTTPRTLGLLAVPPRCSSRSSSSSRASVAARAARPLPAAQRSAANAIGVSGPRRCSRGSSCLPCTSSSCSATAR